MTLLTPPYAWFLLIIVGLILVILLLLYRQRHYVHVSLQHQALEQQLRTHRDQYQTLVNNIPGITYRCLYDEHWTMLFISAHVDSITGYSADELLNNQQTSYAELILPEDNARAGQIVTRAIEQGQSWETEYRLRHKDGSLRWAFERGRAVYDDEGYILYLDGFILDITEEKNAKASLDRFSALVRNSNDAMFIVRQGIIIDCNDATLRMFHYRYDDIVGFDPGHISPTHQADGHLSSERSLAYLQAAAAGEPQRFEWLHQRADGSLFEADVSLSCFQQDDELLAIGIVRDIAEKKRREREIMELNATLEQRVRKRTEELSRALDNLKHTQDELLQREKLASLGALVAGVSHELNTPLGNAVTVSSTLLDHHRAFLQQLERGLTRSALDTFLHDVEESGRIIERNLQRAAELMSSFKQLAVDQTSDQRRTFKLHDVVHEVTLTLLPSLRKASIVLHESISPTLELDSYPGPLGQVLLNLLNNATIHAFAHTDDKQIWVSAVCSSDGWLRLTVADNGCGIDAAHRKRIFDPFFTTRLGQGGSGLGLHITHTLVTGLLGGRIDVESHEYGGALFTVFLPLSAPSLTEPMRNTSA
ncbi:MAG: PAS domain S-box protein [Bacterioplanes sp.]|nr:PAS domain S-box protein [Bacterioplanes sp.]